MIPDLFEQIMAPGRWPAFVLVSARLSGLMLMAPLWSMTNLPRLARAAITVLLAVMLLPSVPATRMPDEVLALPLPLAMELVVGLVIGLTAAILVQGVALAGEVVSLQMGLSLAPQLAPIPDLQVSGVGLILSNLVLLIYVGIGGHLMLLRGLVDSLQTLPPGLPMDLAGGQAAVLAVESLFRCAVSAAAPMMVALLLAEMSIALLSRAVPQINAMMISFPVAIGVGLVMTGAALPFVATSIEGWMHQLPGTVDAFVGALRAAPAGP
jgi:flagellar biosynthetic protein FliR